MSSSRSQAYTDAGVNINAGNELVSRIKSLVGFHPHPGCRIRHRGIRRVVPARA